MSVNPELNALQKEVTRQKILEAGFRLFADRGIDRVTMTDVAEAAGLGVATVYRYYGTKTALAAGISGWSWGQFVDPAIRTAEMSNLTAAQEYAFFLDSFLELYRSHRELLRFNLFFNASLGKDSVAPEVMEPYSAVVARAAERFHVLYGNALRDGTLRTDVPERELFFTSVHLMLAAVTRYAGGLVYDGGVAPERELLLLKDMLLREFSRQETENEDSPYKSHKV